MKMREEGEEEKGYAGIIVKWEKNLA